MHRLKAVLIALAAIGLSVLGLSVSVRAASPVAPDAPRVDTIDVHMSLTDGGPINRGFVSTTTTAYAVVSYEGAANERFLVRQRDLSGIIVKDQRVGPVSGSGTASVAVNVADFVNAYRTAINSQSAVMDEELNAAVEACLPENVPPVPPVWPPNPGPQPTAAPGEPTPTPIPTDPYSLWVQVVLENIEIARTATAGITRTLQSALSLPDVVELPAVGTNFQSAQASFVAADGDLAAAPSLLRPSEQGQRPNPTAGCDELRSARSGADAALSANAAGWAAVPADTTGWRFPPTSARYEGRTFIGCLQYTTDVYMYAGDRPQDTATKSAVWSVGDPGPAALIFPGPDLADRSSIGLLDISLPTNQLAIYARSVTVPNVNHAATVSAYVTDSMCNPVDGVRLGFAASPAGAVTVSPSEVQIVQGVPDVEVRLDAGDAAVNDGVVLASVPGNGTAAATGRGSYQVVGPADRLQIIVNPKTLNLMDPAQNRAGVSVLARDEYGRNVADGTVVQVRIADGDPGQLAYDEERLLDGRLVRTRVELGKSAELVTLGGYTQVPASDDPSVRNGNLYLFGDRTGKLTLAAEADGKTQNTNTNQGEKTLEITGKLAIYLPMLYRGFDSRGPRTASMAVPARSVLSGR